MMQNFKKMLILLLVCVSCKNSITEVKSETTTTDISKIEVQQQDKKVSSSNDKILDNKTKAVKFLKKNNIIKDVFPDSLALSYKNYNLSNYRYNLIKFSYDDRLGDFMTDPIINLLYITKEDKLIVCQNVYSINDDDFEFKFKKGNNYFFEYYDSSTGWKKIITYDFNLSKFFETHKYDDSDNMDIDSIDFVKKEYKLKGKSEVYNFEKIK